MPPTRIFPYPTLQMLSLLNYENSIIIHFFPNSLGFGGKGEWLGMWTHLFLLFCLSDEENV